MPPKTKFAKYKEPKQPTPKDNLEARRIACNKWIGQRIRFYMDENNKAIGKHSGLCINAVLSDHTINGIPTYELRVEGNSGKVITVDSTKQYAEVIH